MPEMVLHRRLVHRHQVGPELLLQCVCAERAETHRGEQKDGGEHQGETGIHYAHANADPRASARDTLIHRRGASLRSLRPMKPNLLVILIDDLRYDEFGAGGHPYMRTPNVDRLAAEGALFERAFHTTPICSPNRASIVTGQYASRHGIIDNVARDAMSHRLPNYHLELQKRGYETAHIGKWHMGNDGKPRPGYDTWVSYDGHGKIVNPTLNHDGRYVEHTGTSPTS